MALLYRQSFDSSSSVRLGLFGTLAVLKYQIILRGIQPNFLLHTLREFPHCVDVWSVCGLYAVCPRFFAR
jgi:hypothetical protein